MSKPLAEDETVAEVMRLHYTDGLGVRAISRRLEIARNTVRRILGRRKRKSPSEHVRPSQLDPYLPTIRQWVLQTPVEGDRDLEAVTRARVHRRYHHRARSGQAAPPARSQSIPDAGLCAGRGDAGRLGRLRLRAARLSPARQRLRRGSLPTRVTSTSSSRSARRWARSCAAWSAACASSAAPPPPTSSTT